MVLNLNHKKLEVYSESRKFVKECYTLTNSFPKEETYGIISQIRRASLSVHLNISEGSSRKSIVERKRYYEISRGSIIEIDAALDVANDLGYLKNMNLEPISESMIRSFKLLSGLINSN